MRSTFKKTQRGQAILPLALVLVFVLGLISITLIGAALVQTQLAGQHAFAEQARQASQSGIEDALLRIARNGTFLDSYSFLVGGKTVTVTVTDSSILLPAPRTRKTIVATTSIQNVRRQLEVVVEVTPTGGVTILSRGELSN